MEQKNRARPLPRRERLIRDLISGDPSAADEFGRILAFAHLRRLEEEEKRQRQGALGSHEDLPAERAGLPSDRNARSRAYLWAIYEARHDFREKIEVCEPPSLSRALASIVRALPVEHQNGRPEVQAKSIEKLARRYGWLDSSGLSGLLDRVEEICEPYDSTP